MMKAETEGDVIAGFENGGRCLEPRNANGVSPSSHLLLYNKVG